MDSDLFEPNSSKEFADLEKAKLQLERENFQREFGLREKELELKKREIEIKEREQRLSSFSSPLFLAVVAATLGLFGNIISTSLQNAANRTITEAKNQADLRLAQQKSRSDLILEAIKTGDSQKARQNLLFFIHAGLIEDPSGTIQQTAQEQAPSLPSVTSAVIKTAPGPMTAHVRGSVKDAVTGLPIGGASVTFRASGSVIDVNAVDDSDAEGRYEVTIFYPSTYQVVAQARGYTPAVRQLVLEQAKMDDFNLSLTPASKK